MWKQQSLMSSNNEYLHALHDAYNCVEMIIVKREYYYNIISSEEFNLIYGSRK